MKMGYKKSLDFGFDEAVEKVRESVSKEGFGVVSEVKVSNLLRSKLNVDFEDYIIIGVCNPAYAHKVLSVDKEMGLLLPCNVVVYVENGKVFVSAILPTEAMKGIENEKLKRIALEVEEKLKRIVDNI
jgi:uncharacterized protein (DUF302 family)